MTKKELVSAACKATGRDDVSAALCADVLRSLVSVIHTQLASGNAVMVHGIGTFSVVKRPARKARNPRTGAEVDVPAKTKAHFVAVAALHHAASVSAA